MATKKAAPRTSTRRPSASANGQGTAPFTRNYDWPERRVLIGLMPEKGGSLADAITRHNIRASVVISEAEKKAVGYKKIEILDKGNFMGTYTTWEKEEIVVAGRPIDLSASEVLYLLQCGEKLLQDNDFPDNALELLQEMDAWLPKPKKRTSQEEERMSWQG